MDRKDFKTIGTELREAISLLYIDEDVDIIIQAIYEVLDPYFPDVLCWGLFGDKPKKELWIIKTKSSG